MKRLITTLGLAAMLVAGAATIEDSPLFERRVDPYSGVASYILKPGKFAFSQQSLYFVSISMTDDARFLLFLAQEPETDAKKKVDKQLWAVDVARGAAYPIAAEGTKLGRPWMDTKTGDIYLLEKTAFYKLNVADPAGTRKKLFDLPPEFLALGEIKSPCMHLTLTPDCRTAFLDTTLRNPAKWVQGAIDMTHGTYAKWSESWYELVHGQINPADPRLGLVALQPAGDKTKAKEMPPNAEYLTHTYGCRAPGRRCYRMHVVSPGRPVDHVMTPEGVHATHEIWSRDGQWIYWCDNGGGPLGGVWRQSLAKRQSERVVPFPAVHAMPSRDHRYVVYDRSYAGGWRGGHWRVEFYNRDTLRRCLIHSAMAPICPKERPSTRHPDPHPQFVANDRYVVCTYNNADGHMDVSVTPVDQLVRKTSCPAPAGLDDFPAEAAVKDTVAKVTDLLFTTPPEAYRTAGCNAKRRNYGGGKLMYCTVSLWATAIACARQGGDEARLKKLLDLFEPFYGEKAKCIPAADHVDRTIFGALPLAVYAANHDARALELGLRFADGQWAKPDPAAKIDPQNLPFDEQLALWRRGLSPQTRFWIDDMYMITFLQVQAFKATGDKKYLSRMAAEVALYLEKLQRPDGLFDHAPGVPFVWGRGDGWVAGGMALMADILEQDINDPNYAAVYVGYLKMMKALARWQRPNGLWGQLVDDPASWDETSCSAMFAYAMAVGVRLGWLDAEEYAPRVRRAYLALVGKLTPDGDLRDICDGTVKKNDRDHYLNRPKVIGAPYGQAALLWLCEELLKLK